MTVDQDRGRPGEVQLSTGVEIKGLTIGDAERYFQLIGFDPDHHRQFGDRTADKYPDVESIERSIADQSESVHRFGIWTNEMESEMVGIIELTELGEGCFEVGYWVGKSHVGNGFARKALKEVETYAFGQLDALQLTAYVDKDNEASKSTVGRAGYQLLKDDDQILVYVKGDW